MREIEVKYQVLDREALLLALKERGVWLSEPVWQDDQAYAPAGWDFGDDKTGVAFARLRTAGGCHTFTVKRPDLNAQSCTERETEVMDREAMHEAVQLMGYRPTVRVAKTRRTGMLDGVELCLDDLEGVGLFMELERIVPDGADEAAVQEEMAALVATLGVEMERTSATYDALVRRHWGRLGRWGRIAATTCSGGSAPTW
ncbi:class IV adenylate cyclase [Streptomyces sp. HK10]|uniref:class IV adenylate cyclase n=1 Tax=Streptomyces sp. HK10 TaxID=3373255 RepID=UPI00374955A2